MGNNTVLWEQGQCAAWEAALAAYPAAVEARGGPKLLALDRWVHDELPGEVRSREPRHLMHDELLRVVRWKMGRGVWRAENPPRVAGHPPGGRAGGCGGGGGARGGGGRGPVGASP